VKHLVDKVWNRGGKLILDTAFGVPDEAPVEGARDVCCGTALRRLRRRGAGRDP
jgi:hypothetical protein